MKPFQHTKKIIFLAFLLSILFHTGSVIYVAIKKSNQQSMPPLDDENNELQQKMKPHDEWAETKARAGNFGAPVMFVDDPDASLTEAVEDELEDELEKTSPLEEEPQQLVNNKIEIPEEKNIILENTKISSALVTEPQPSAIPRPTPSLAPPSHKASEDKPGGHGKVTQDKQHAPRQFAAPKPPITLAQLTQGFLDHMKNEGTHAIHMLGKKNGRPSDEQIKYERYLQKLSWCLQNSFNIHNGRFPSSAHMEDTVHVLLALNKDGSLKHCRVVKTSGNRELDNFTMFIFNDASSSFPPVPQYLPHDPFTINYIIMVSATQENRFKLYRQ